MGQAVYGQGISDLYAGMQSGVMFPFVPFSPALAGAPAWPTNIDQGLVTYDINPGGFALHPIQWTSLLVGLEYYLPGLDGQVWISGNYSHIESNNTSQFARALTDTPNPGEYFYPASTAQVRRAEDWWDANLFFDPCPACASGSSSRRSTTTTWTASPPRTTAPRPPGSSSSRASGHPVTRPATSSLPSRTS